MRLFVILSIISLCVTSFYSQSTPLPSEFQSWNEVQLILPLVRDKNTDGKSIDKLTATFNGIVRIGSNNANFVDNRIGAALDFRVNKYVTLISGVLYRKDEAIKGIRRYETRLGVGAIFSKTFHNFTFRDRNLFEHRFRNGRIDTNIYRQRIHVSRPVKFNKKEWFTPFISDERLLRFAFKNLDSK